MSKTKPKRGRSLATVSVSSIRTLGGRSSGEPKRSDTTAICRNRSRAASTCSHVR